MTFIVYINPNSATIYENQVLYLSCQMADEEAPDYAHTRQRSNVVWHNSTTSETLLGEDPRQHCLRFSPLELGYPAGSYSIYAVATDPVSNAVGSAPTVVVTVLAGNAPRTKVWAKSGFPEDIQSAIEEVKAGTGLGDVFVPEGDFLFDANVNIVVLPAGWGLYGAGKNKTILRMPTTPPSTSTMIDVDANNGITGTRIGGISLIGYVSALGEAVNNMGMKLNKVPDFRIFDCSVADFPMAGINVSNATMPFGLMRGLIDHCTIDNPYKEVYPQSNWGYGVFVAGNWHAWEPASYYMGKFDGKHDVLYIEDCNFTRCRHSVTSQTAAWYTVRHSTFANPRPYGYAMIDVHGCYAPVSWCSNRIDTDRVTCEANGGTWYKSSAGARGAEIYDNRITGEADPYGGGVNLAIAIQYRGGAGIVTRNIISSCQADGRQYYAGAVSFIHEPMSTGESTCADSARFLFDIYAYSNTFYSCVKNYGTDNAYSPTPAITEGVNYFLTPPPTGLWTEYVYPHPFALETPPTPPPVVTPLHRKVQDGLYEISAVSSQNVGGVAWQFDHWEDDVEPYSIGNTRQVTVDADKAYRAIYVQATVQATVNGFVKLQNGNPAVGATVKLGDVTYVAQIDGSYTFTVPAGVYTLTASTAGYAEYTTSVDASAGGTITVPEITLTGEGFPIVYVGGFGAAAALLLLLAGRRKKKKNKKR